MIKAKFFAVFLAVFLSCFNVFGQLQTPNPVKPATQIFPIAELKEGMRGTARTVFHGTEPEEFNVEILGVIPNWIGPKQDLIVGRLSGANAERTSVFAGMSGSPVYINGRLVGAISYSFPFSKEPICGITSFEQMLFAVEQSGAVVAASSEPKAFSFKELLANTWRPDLANRTATRGPLSSGFSSDSRLMAIAGQTFRPIATPITFSGVSQETLDLFAPELIGAGLLPVAASGGSSSIAPLKKVDESTLVGGDSVVVHLARGDISIAAAGTVTNRDGDKIYAFGHTFFGLGTANLPMSESHVVTVVPNVNNSFKLAVADATVGSMTQDRATGIFGKLGESPKMLPVKISLTTSRGRNVEVNFDSAFDDILTPLIVNAGVYNTLTANERGLGDSTIEFNGEIRVKGEEPVRIKRRFTGGQASLFAASATAIPLGALLRAGFDGMEITDVTVNMTVVDGSKTASIERISIDRTQVRAGETIEVQAFARTDSGKILVQKIPVTIPADTAAGPLSITVGDGNAVQQNAAAQQFVPKNTAELIRTINRMKRPDRLYAIVFRNSSGAIVGVSEMPNLPPSVLATLNNDRTAGGSKIFVQTVVSEQEILPGENVISGQQTLSFEVIR